MRIKHKRVFSKEARTVFGKRVFEARKRMGISQELLAKRSGTFQSEISLTEHGYTCLSLWKIESLSAVLGIQYKDLIAG